MLHHHWILQITQRCHSDIKDFLQIIIIRTAERCSSRGAFYKHLWFFIFYSKRARCKGVTLYLKWIQVAWSGFLTINQPAANKQFLTCGTTWKQIENCISIFTQWDIFLYWISHNIFIYPSIDYFRLLHLFHQIQMNL